MQLQAWEAPYQFPMPLEGRYWDGDFRCDGDENRPCRGARKKHLPGGFSRFVSEVVFQTTTNDNDNQRHVSPVIVCPQYPKLRLVLQAAQFRLSRRTIIAARRTASLF